MQFICVLCSYKGSNLNSIQWLFYNKFKPCCVYILIFFLQMHHLFHQHDLKSQQNKKLTHRIIISKHYLIWDRILKLFRLASHTYSSHNNMSLVKWVRHRLRCLYQDRMSRTLCNDSCEFRTLQISQSPASHPSQDLEPQTCRMAPHGFVSGARPSPPLQSVRSRNLPF